MIVCHIVEADHLYGLMHTKVVGPDHKFTSNAAFIDRN